MIARMTPATGKENICSHLHLDEIVAHTNQDIANMINSALLEPMQDYTLLSCLPPLADNSELLVVSPSEVFNALLQLNPRKAGGPDGINNWLLRDYVGFLTFPVCNILNAMHHLLSRNSQGPGRMLLSHRQAYSTYLPDTSFVQIS